MSAGPVRQHVERDESNKPVKIIFHNKAGLHHLHEGVLIKGYSLIIEQVRNNRGAAQSGNIQNGIVDILLIPIIKEIEANELPTMADAVKIDFW